MSNDKQGRMAQVTAESLERNCPADCAMCSGEACDLCGAGCWSDATDCRHDVTERHTVAQYRPMAEDTLEWVKCEVADCNEPQSCFHYCQPHHLSICNPPTYATTRLGCASHGFNFRDGCDACQTTEPQTEPRVCQRGVDGSEGCGHEESSSIVGAGICLEMNADGVGYCAHACDFSPLEAPQDAHKLSMPYSYHAFDPDDSGECADQYGVLTCGQPADAPVHKVEGERRITAEMLVEQVGRFVLIAAVRADLLELFKTAIVNARADGHDEYKELLARTELARAPAPPVASEPQSSIQERARRAADKIAPHLDPYFRLNRDWQEQVASIITAEFAAIPDVPQRPTTSLLQKIVEICDAGSSREFGDAEERLRAVRGLIIGESA